MRERVLLMTGQEVVTTIDLAAVDVLTDEGGAELLVRLRAALGEVRRERTGRRRAVRG